MSDSARAAQCDYCGLPVTQAAQVDQPQYCCFGCRFAASVMNSEGGEPSSHVRAAMTRLGLALFFAMNVMVFTFFLWSEQPAHQGEQARVLFDLARYLTLLLSTPVLLLLGRPLLEDAWQELRHGRASLSMLLLAGVVASFMYSAYSVFSGSGHVYFEVGCMVLVAISLGRWLEASGKLQTTAELRKLQNLLPDVVQRVVGTSSELVALPSVVVNDLLRFLPGETIAVDGQITRGEASIDECMVTGESEPAHKRSGDAVYSGTSNLDGELWVRVTAPPGAGTIERLINAVLQAVQGRTRLERLAERISKVFLPAVVVIALATLVWHTAYVDLASGILHALAVVVISCPCALGLATPMALWAAIGEATRRHILVRDGDAFARLATATVFCFDKTGTLTHGCEVAGLQIETGHDRCDPLALAAALAQASHHPLSEAIARYAFQSQTVPVEVASVRSVAGRGMRGVLSSTGAEVLLGSSAWLRSLEVDFPDDDLATVQAEHSVILLAVAGQLVARFTIRQRLRPGAHAMLTALRKSGARTLILSGDEYRRAAEIAGALDCEVQAPLLPDEKLQVIRELQVAGNCVVMIGDGLNDAPALAAADVGIALGCGADVSRWSGSLCLLNDQLDALPWLVDLSRRTTRTIRWNLLWAFGYNGVCIPLAAVGWLHPAIAAGAMVASSLLVVSNSLRLAATDAAVRPEEEPVIATGLAFASKPALEAAV